MWTEEVDDAQPVGVCAAPSAGPALALRLLERGPVAPRGLAQREAEAGPRRVQSQRMIERADESSTRAVGPGR